MIRIRIITLAVDIRRPSFRILRWTSTPFSTFATSVCLPSGRRMPAPSLPGRIVLPFGGVSTRKPKLRLPVWRQS